MYNGNETEEQRQDRYRKQVLDELNHSGNNKNINTNIQSYGQTNKVSKVSFNKNNDNVNNNINNYNSMNSYPTNDVNSSVKNYSNSEQNSSANNNNNNNNQSNKGGIIVGVLILLIVVLLISVIPGKSSEKNLKERKSNIKLEEPAEKVYEKLTLNSQEVKDVVYPIMHIDNGNKKTYHSLSKVTVGNFSNNDILYNAFVNIYDGFIANYKGKYNGKFCGKYKSSVNNRYLRLNLDSLFTEKAKYSLSNFVVPVNNTVTKYVGTWKYDKVSEQFIYYGDCTKTKAASTLYFDIKVPYDATSSDKNIELYVYNYMAFAKVDTKNKSYVLYSDANYTKEITKGTLKTNKYETELTNILKNYNKNNLNKYKYTFSIVNCPYQDYCFVSGEWVK